MHPLASPEHSERAAPDVTRPRSRRALGLSTSDPRVRAVAWQILIVGSVAVAAWYLVTNTAQNLQQRHIATGFAFLDRVAGIPIGETPLAYDPAVNSYGRAIVIGILNTLRVSLVGIVLSTVLGTLIGVARLSPNWLLAKLSAVYVEWLRDIPVLLQLLFWYTLLQNLPAPGQAFHLGDLVFLSNRGIRLPLLDWQAAHGWAAVSLLLGAGGAVAWSRFARHRQTATGGRPAVWPVALALIGVLPLVVWAALGAPFDLEKPVRRGFNFVGGATISPEFGALLAGLVTYTAAFIAEIVRAGIEAVSHGQSEAGRSLGLRRGLILRKIVLPQALRVIVPPLISQYLNLTKNSSLAVAIGYQDLTSIASTTLIQTGQAIEGITIIMVVYLSISLTLSLLMNWYNARIALVER
jgi:general L-amino acid transport system permease protein